MTNGQDTQLVGDKVYFVGANLLLGGRVMGCRVGVVAVPYNQLKHNMHRVGVVAELIAPVKWEGAGKNHPVNFAYRGNGMARVALADGDFQMDTDREGGKTMPVDLCSDDSNGGKNNDNVKSGSTGVGTKSADGGAKKTKLSAGCRII